MLESSETQAFIQTNKADYLKIQFLKIYRFYLSLCSRHAEEDSYSAASSADVDPASFSKVGQNLEATQ